MCLLWLLILPNRDLSQPRRQDDLVPPTVFTESLLSGCIKPIGTEALSRWAWWNGRNLGNDLLCLECRSLHGRVDGSAKPRRQVYRNVAGARLKAHMQVAIEVIGHETNEDVACARGCLDP